jgi:molecular chaperone DnaK
MTRTTIDYGIDLGTTNSAIALAAGGQTEIIKNNLDTDTTPSAVYINRTGSMWVGQSARSKIADERTEEDVHMEFKRRMGTGQDYLFRASGRRLRPEALAAEILKSLRADVAQKKGEDITSAVITVPAAFELHQCDATRAAAQLAGFTHAPLLQEPVAAALAYGFNRLDAKAHWLVFDFGGGTFDAALIRAQDGSLVVANHEGDNFLGGSDLDWMIAEQLLLPRIQAEFKNPNFKRGEARHKHDLLRLKAAAETAKIDLSRKERTYLEVALRTLTGETVTFETELTRAEIARVCEPAIVKAAAVARRTLTAKGLAPSAIEKLIFVGGPTLAPYFRELVAGHLPIPCDHSVDPHTVVARGAALFASGQPLATPAAARPRAAGEKAALPLTLVYKPVGSDPEPLIGGRVGPGPAFEAAACTVELVHNGTKWRSGRVALRPDGAFQLHARAERGTANTFTVEIRSATGSLIAVTPDRFNYTIGLAVEEQTVIHTLGIAQADNQVAVHFAKGHPLPAKATRTYRTAAAVAKGATSLLRIPIIEGNQSRADRNLLIGAIEVAAAQLRRDLPAGTEVEVTLKLDSSRLLAVVAYVPLLDAEFPARIELGDETRRPAAPALQAELATELARAEALARELPPGDPAFKILASLRGTPLAQRLDAVLHRAEPDVDELLRAERDLLDLKLQIDAHETDAQWPAITRRARAQLTSLQTLAEEHGTGEERLRVRQLSVQLEDALKDRATERLRQKLAEVEDCRSAINYRVPAFWIQHLEAIAACRDQLTEPAAADLLIAEGRRLAAVQNLEALKETIFRLQDYLPPQGTTTPAHAAYGSTVLA